MGLADGRCRLRVLPGVSGDHLQRQEVVQEAALMRVAECATGGIWFEA